MTATPTPSAGVRCPYCHDEALDPAGLAACASCATLHHRQGLELGQLGVEPELRPGVLDRRRPLRALAALLLVGSLGAGTAPGIASGSHRGRGPRVLRHFVTGLDELLGTVTRPGSPRSSGT